MTYNGHKNRVTWLVSVWDIFSYDCYHDMTEEDARATIECLFEELGIDFGATSFVVDCINTIVDSIDYTAIVADIEEI